MIKKIIPFVILGLTAVIATVAIVLAVVVTSPAGRLENALNSYTNFTVDYITDGIYALSKDYATQGSTGTQLVFHNKDYSKEYDFQAGYTPLGSYFSALTPDFQGKVIRSGPDAHIFTSSLESYVTILEENRIEVDREILREEVARIVQEKFTAVIKSADIKSDGDVFSLKITKAQIEDFINEFKNSEIVNSSLPAVINFGGLCDRLLTFAADIDYSAKITDGAIVEHTIISGENTLVLSIFDKDVDVDINGELFTGKLVHWEKGGVPLPAIPPDEIKHDWSYENGFTW
jgi:hypothetical protein